MNSQLREKAIRLRLDKRASYSEISKILKVSKSTLSYWLKDFPLNKEEILELRRKCWSKGEASREKYRLTMRTKKEDFAREMYSEKFEKMKNFSKDSFFTAGLMLYLAEGAKKKESAIVLANTDYRVIKFFIKWLKEFMTIIPKDLRIQLHLYENMDIQKEVIFWIRALGLKKSQIYKPSIRKLQKGSFTYGESYRHGTCSLYAFGVKKTTELLMSIKAFVDLYLK